MIVMLSDLFEQGQVYMLYKGSTCLHTICVNYLTTPQVTTIICNCTYCLVGGKHVNSIKQLYAVP